MTFHVDSIPITRDETFCPICKKHYREGDRAFQTLTELPCQSCADQNHLFTFHPYLFHQGKLRALFNVRTPEKLRSDIYRLRYIDEMYVLFPKEAPAENSEFLLECRNGKTLLHFPQEMYTSCAGLLALFETGAHKELLKAFAKYALKDSKDQVTGVAVTDEDVFTLPRLLFDDFSFSFVSCTVLKEEFAYQQSVAESLKRITPQMLLRFCEGRIQGQGIQLRKAVYLVWKYFQNIASEKPFTADNWLLTAPSGSGKTEFYRTIRDFCKLHKIPVPVVQIDMNKITEEGFKGLDPSAIPKRILELNTQAGGFAICFLDEADKRFMPSFDSHGENINSHIQGNLLTMIEGEELHIEVKNKEYPFDTSRTMFVLAGAFQDLRGKKQRAVCRQEKTIGFGTAPEHPADPAESFYESLTLDEIVAFGMQEELAGRLTQIINFQRLSESDMRRLLRSKTRSISEEMGICIELTAQGETALLSIAFGNLGVRQPLNRIRELTQNTIAAVFFDDGFDPQCDKIIIEGLDSARIAPTSCPQLDRLFSPLYCA